jgi:CBS domain containing-hemolysin-like protein
MDPVLVLVKVMLLVLFFGLSAFFSASETALFSLDVIKIKRLAQEGKRTCYIVKLLENPLRCLTTILAGNTLVNIAISSILTTLLIDLIGNAGVSVSIGVTTLLLLMFGEVTPKTIAIHNNERLSYLFAPPLYFFMRIVTPFLFLATRICDSIISWTRLHPRKEPTLTEEEFRTVMEVGHRHGVVGKSEKEMVVSILELTTTRVDEIMVPRTDIKALSIDADRAHALHMAARVKHSRLPVYKDSLDNILGLVFTKDLFLLEDKPWTELVKPVLCVPETKRIDELLKEFYRQNKKTAVVVDEYGGTAGFVSLEDILEEIFGEIKDEFKAKENLIEALGDGRFRISGKAPVYKVNEDCQVAIIPGEYETVAGFLLDVAGHIPVEGEEIQAVGGVFTIEKLAGRRIKTIVFKKP